MSKDQMNGNSIKNVKYEKSKESHHSSTFNTLLELQLLIKKESGLKELCKFLLTT